MLIGQPGNERIASANPQEPFTHLGEVGNDPDHVGNGGRDFVFDIRQKVGMAAAQPDLRPRFHLRPGRPSGAPLDHLDQLVIAISNDRQHREDQQLDPEGSTIEHHSDRVDEKRNVVRDEKEYGAARRPGLCRRHDCLDERLSFCTVSTEFEMSRSNTHHIAEIPIFDVVDRNIAVVFGHEAIGERIIRIQATRSGGERVEFQGR